MTICFSARNKMSGLFRVEQASPAKKDFYLPFIHDCFHKQNLLNGFAFIEQSQGDAGVNVNLLIQHGVDVEEIQRARSLALAEFDIAKFTVTECPPDWFDTISMQSIS